ncbi:condensin complex subunit SMC2 [Fomitopsis serialis]|uniref:condensin complex subunit SMC2 n=1 Tax=Fomitopsis serialis TaxID=139415 RepID=UPI002007445D|nr:condensin complex subunit SMC2 [Neoantrodia serialis]KAH9917715.1 condensin complex subunit SMC2 [Neoantrodia serialis]
MRIEELVLEGFKSYPVRTQITGWDSSFNAITGLNGSGKSNILDAICFVLGITNMSSMRAQNQQDLIYKRGQAGITKASVTIVFDNSDRSTSPVGLENCKQITVTRQIALPNISKYLLNGHKSQQHTIQTLFQSVQLNINNPNFLIMQGRITKVLNMRPQEILGMVEEAAGTRMFEERKDKAKKTMGKKEKRVQEITSLLAEEIEPKLDTLREEKRSFLQWQKSCSELERIGRVLRAWEWTEGHERVAKKEAEIQAKEKETKSVKKGKERCGKEIEAAERDAKEVEAQREKELRKGGKFKQLEDEVAELGKVLVKIKTQVEIKMGTITDEEERIKELENELAELTENLAQKKSQVEELTAAHSNVKDTQTALQTALTNSEELLQTLLTGLTSKGTSNSGGGYMGQLADAKARLAQANTEEEQGKQRLVMSQKELKTLESRWKEVEREAGEGQKRLKAMQAEVESFRSKVAQAGWSQEKEHEGELALRNAKAEVRQVTEDRDRVRNRVSNLDFEFTSPSPNFDRTKVKGLVANLVSLRQEDYNKSTALEITAGGRLYNVVVATEQVGKELLQNGRLKKRVTIIPLNKIDSRTISASKVQAAMRLAPGKVRLAMELVGYPDEVANAMAFVFGNTLICDDAESAKLVTFSRELGGVRSVTLDGDVYDPSGMLSGGSAPSGNGTLIKVQELLEVEGKLGEARGRLQILEQQEQRDRAGREKWKSLARELEIKEHEMRLLEEQVGGSNAARVGAEVEKMKANIAELAAAVETAKQKQKDGKDEIKKLERDMDEFKNNKEGKIEELKADVSKQKAALQKHSVTVKTQQKELQTASLELEQLEKDIESSNENIAEARAGVDKLGRELEKLKKELSKSEDSFKKAERKLQEERATLSRFDNEIKELERVVKEKKQAIVDADLQLKKLEHDLQALAKEKTAATNFIANLEKQYDWIVEEHESFGKPGSQYDFTDVDINRLREKAKEIESQQKGMKKKINPKVINMIDTVEKKEAALKKMLGTVLKDKEKIEQTIEELDRYKRDALEKTWSKVNGDFGGIFAELLPGNFAKLQPPEGQDLTQGLEVKVQLGSVWKQSLTELSGGQRSLIALSLIMSLLQFKPAPMYILDEIDAALDLSHTQHIGQLFRTRFKGSQFIVVSLKEGLFTNANVLFRTRFRDGTSIVERTAQRSTSSLYSAGDGEDDDGRAPRRVRAGR